tara:strand:+ start:2545 stop:2904 length:360 start_codon:yes stop_codon:yes gene_type:complete
MSNDKKIPETIPDICVLKFEAQWCGPCKAISPYIEQMKKDFPEIPVFNIDADENPDICSKYGITKLPTFVFLNNGFRRDIIGIDKTTIKLEFDRIKNNMPNQIPDQNLPQHQEARIQSS